MATLATLLDRDELVQIDVHLRQHQVAECLMLATHECADWFIEVLPNLRTTAIGGKQSPLEQLDALFEKFVLAKQLNYGRDFWHMFPHEDEVWELKTDDVRIFGWFPTPDVFVCVVANDSDFVHKHRLHSGYVGEVVRFRNSLNLDEPKAVPAAQVKAHWNVKDHDDD